MTMQANIFLRLMFVMMVLPVLPKGIDGDCFLLSPPVGVLAKRTL